MIDLLIQILIILAEAVSALYIFRTLFAVTGAFATRRFPEAKKLHRYAILIAARNEETVLGNLIDSIRRQDYPRELVDIFVVADNCTDGTEAVARRYGAYTCVRSDTRHATKGYALQYLVEYIRREHGLDRYEGYFIFDADNLLKASFLRKMNDAFDAGEKIVTAYRNTKNFDDNWISASYGIHWLRTVRSEHRARSLFRLATRIQGTGFLFARELIDGGWNYTSLTEDRAFCADAVAGGYRISYQDEAEFYDEQPVSLSIAMRQRIRWAKGHLQALGETGGKLLLHCFFTGGTANRDCADRRWWMRLLRNLRLRFMSFDMFTVVLPRSLILFLQKICVYCLRIALIFTAGYAFVNSSLAPKAAAVAIELLGLSTQACSTAQAVRMLTLFALAGSMGIYLGGFFTAAYVFILERRRIAPIKWYRKLWYCLTFPMFDLMGKLASCIALFVRVDWKPIPHNSNVRIEQLDGQPQNK